MRGYHFVVVVVVVLSVLAPPAAGGSFADARGTHESVQSFVEPTDRTDGSGHDRVRSTGRQDATNVTTAGNGTERVVVFFESFAARDAPNPGGPELSVRGGRDVDFAPVLFASVPTDAIAAVEARPGVDTVVKDQRTSLATTPDQSIHDRNGTTTLATQVTPWGVTRLGARDAASGVPESAQSDVTVAVLDTGIDYTHPNLDGNVVWGANYSDNASETGLETSMDTNGHGTAVAGIIAAEDDGSGVVGVAPNASLYSIKVLNSDGLGRESWLIAGIEAAIEGEDGVVGTDDDADVLSISIGASRSSEGVRQAIEYANEHAVVVAAAGNNGNDPDVDGALYPAKYPESIAVAATDRDDETPSFSASGEAVELAAPGVSVETTNRTGGVVSFTGTSASAPHVAGVAALVIADDASDGSRDLSNRDVRERLRNTTVDIEAAGVDDDSGYGLVQADAAVSNVDPTANLTGTVLSNDSDPIDGASVSVYVDGSGESVATAATPADGSFRFEALEPGRDYTIEATDGNVTETASVSNIDEGTTERNVVLPERTEASVNLTGTAPDTVERGQAVDVQYAVTNVGDGAAETGSLELGLPANVTVDNGTSHSLPTSLDPGETWTVDVSLSFDGPFDAGELQVDSTATLGSDTTNRSKTVQLVETNASLSGNDTTVATLGEIVTLTYELRNDGSTHPSDGVVWIDSLAEPLELTSNQTLVLNGTSEVPAPNETATYKVDVRVSNSTTTGNYSVVAGGMLGLDDPDDDVVAELHNTSTVGPTPGIDLDVLNATISVTEAQSTVVEQYDTNGEAGIQGQELWAAFDDWKRSELSVSGLLDVFEVWKST